jgi:hypothetical protein
MTKQTDSFDSLRIASPCPVGWEKMKGNEQVRFCDQCQLNVYNLSGMTRKQAEAVVHQTEGRICARFYRRADGTILTRDCPVGLHALRRRAVKIAGAAVTAVMSLCLTAMGQTKSSVCETSASKAKVKITKPKDAAQNSFATISGELTDSQGAVVPAINIRLINDRTKEEFKTVSGEDGKFNFGLLEADSYTLKIDKVVGFAALQVKDIVVRSGEAARLDVALPAVVSGETVWVGMVAAPSIDTTTPGGTTIITSDMIQNLPHED